MSDQHRTDQRVTIGRREADYELPALRLHKAELKIDELDMLLRGLL